MNSNHKTFNEKKQEKDSAAAKANAVNSNAVNKKKDIKSEADTGENCEPDPLKGMSYIPPKDENTL